MHTLEQSLKVNTVKQYGGDKVHIRQKNSENSLIKAKGKAEFQTHTSVGEAKAPTTGRDGKIASTQHPQLHIRGKRLI